MFCLTFQSLYFKRTKQLVLPSFPEKILLHVCRLLLILLLLLLGIAVLWARNGFK